jgi:hypothetical protein
MEIRRFRSPASKPFPLVAANGPQVPESLEAQLKIGGWLVISVGADQRVQELVRVPRVSENEYRSEGIADVRFVPLIGEKGWVTGKEGEARARARRALRWFLRKRNRRSGTSPTQRDSFPSIGADLNPLMERIRNRVREPLFPGLVCRGNSTNTCGSTKLAR